MSELAQNPDFVESDFALSRPPDSTPSATPSRPFGLPTVPGYELLDAVGRGGMGVVFRARHVRLNRLVAIKLLPNAETVEANVVSRFLAEAQSVADIKHPNVVEVYDFGEAAVPGQAAAVPFLVMELLEGGHLGDVLGTTRDPQVIATTLAKVCRGVAAAHAANIVHRDLKPTNILFTKNGEPKVVDFGLAKRAISTLTLSVAVMGTPYYMSPEQAKGKSKSVGPPTDVWALGVILYQALTGRLPFDSDNQFSLLHQIITEEPEPPRVHNTVLPPVLERIVLKCLMKSLEQRFATASELADVLERFAAGEAVEVGRPPRSRPAIDWAMVVVIFLLAGMAGTCFLMWQKEAAENQQRRELILKRVPLSPEP
jgi:serine/threonine-protein kinase